MNLRIVILGLSISSSWGNGHATVYRALVSALLRRGHQLLFLERDKPWYAKNRDLDGPLSDHVAYYRGIGDLRRRFTRRVREADLVLVGSYVPDGCAVGRWVLETATGKTGFYDIDTPVTLAAMRNGTCDYLAPDLIPGFSFYLSFTGGPILKEIQRGFGARIVQPFYCCADPEVYFPDSAATKKFALGYLGTFSEDRMEALTELLLHPASAMPSQKFIVAGSMYPPGIQWPSNVVKSEHVPPWAHRGFYNSLRFTLNLTRAEMVRTGYSPSVRLFEAAACAVPIISDPWAGLEEIFEPGKEIFVAHSAQEVGKILANTSPAEMRKVGNRARLRVMEEHTGIRRAIDLERLMGEPSCSSDQKPTALSIRIP